MGLLGKGGDTPLQLTMHGRTDAGQVRDHNEDTFWYNEELGAAIVADGIGGHAAGEVASKLTVQAFERTVLKKLSRARELDHIRAMLGESIVVANRRVLSTIERDPARNGMGSTAVCACLWREVFVIAHIGDSRAYLVRDGAITQLTKDHSFVQSLVDQGVIQPEEAAVHPRRNIITRCVGDPAEAEADLCALEAEPGDMLLLCSDGLTEVLGDDEILAVCQQYRSVRRICNVLVQRTLEGGAPDNVTVLTMSLGGGRAWSTACAIFCRRTSCRAWSPNWALCRRCPTGGRLLTPFLLRISFPQDTI